MGFPYTTILLPAAPRSGRYRLTYTAQALQNDGKPLSIAVSIHNRLSIPWSPAAMDWHDVPADQPKAVTAEYVLEQGDQLHLYGWTLTHRNHVQDELKKKREGPGVALARSIVRAPRPRHRRAARGRRHHRQLATRELPGALRRPSAAPGTRWEGRRLGARIRPAPGRRAAPDPALPPSGLPPHRSGAGPPTVPRARPRRPRPRRGVPRGDAHRLQVHPVLTTADLLRRAAGPPRRRGDREPDGVLPLVLAPGRRTAARGRGGRTRPRGRAPGAGGTHAARSAGRALPADLHRPVAGPAEDRCDGPG